jgi:hypothetical protein
LIWPRFGSDEAWSRDSSVLARTLADTGASGEGASAVTLAESPRDCSFVRLVEEHVVRMVTTLQPFRSDDGTTEMRTILGADSVFAGSNSDWSPPEGQCVVSLIFHDRESDDSIEVRVRETTLRQFAEYEAELGHSGSPAERAAAQLSIAVLEIVNTYVEGDPKQVLL